MFSPEEIKQKFFPGQEWCYFRLYMGPETAEEWLCYNLPIIIRDLNEEIPGFQYYYLRYLDPDFHLRLRIRLPNYGNFGKVVNIINLHSALLLRQGLIWKVEIATYEREVERYGTDQIEMYESVFNADSKFWLSVLPWLGLQDEHEELRWRIALLSAARYYNDLIPDKGRVIEIIDQVISNLKKEQKISRTFQYQIDQKLRALRPELLALLGDGLANHPRITAKLDNRSFLISELFEPSRKAGNYFPGSRGDQSITDIVHMSLNRGLRARHRTQEYVIYCFLGKIFRTQLALA